MKVALKQLSEYVTLYRDSKNGIAWVENGHTGCGHSCHPNIDASGSVRGMKARGHWGKNDRVVRSHGFIHNIDRVVVSDDLDEVASAHCLCIACAERRCDARPIEAARPTPVVE